VARAVPRETSAQALISIGDAHSPLERIQLHGLRIRDSGLLICDLRLLNRWDCRSLIVDLFQVPDSSNENQEPDRKSEIVNHQRIQNQRSSNQ
jgi:hypothetical protein